MQARSLLVGALLAASGFAQTAIWTPNGYAAVAGNSNNAFPWNWGSTQIHYLQVYSSTDFTLQGASGQVQITRLRFRTSSGSAASGGSWSNVVINMSNAATTYSTISTTFAANHGANLTNVYTGPVTVMPVTASTPGQVYIDIALTTPLLYDTAAGDLCLEVVNGGAGWTGGSAQCDAVSQTGPGGPALARRVYNISSSTATTGSTDGYDYGLVTEFTWQPALNYATRSVYGNGCYNSAVSFYENFVGAPTFDLGGSASTVNTVMMVPNGQGGYTVIPGGNTWWTPVGPNLGLGDDTSSAPISIPFSIPYPGGSTSSLIVSSNGVIGLTATGGTLTGYPSTGTLLSEGARFAPLWTDLDPSAATGGGTVILDIDAPNGVVYVTWTAVPIWEATPSNPRFLNTLQVALHSNGLAEFRYMACSEPPTAGLNVLVGFSPGGTSRDPGNRDISVAMPFSTQTDRSALAEAASARPVIGTSINLVTTNIPTGTAVGANILSFTQHNPGLDLTSIGMPGCRQYVNLDTTNVFVVSGSSASVALSIPNIPGLAGLHVYSQSATFTPGFNPLGVIASNGVALKLDIN